LSSSSTAQKRAAASEACIIPGSDDCTPWGL
jgi:hypothetical protein